MDTCGKRASHCRRTPHFLSQPIARGSFFETDMFNLTVSATVSNLMSSRSAVAHSSSLMKKNTNNTSPGMTNTPLKVSASSR